MNAPIQLEYAGDGMFRAPTPFWADLCDKQFVVHERYRMVEHQERSMNSHRHYFASVSAAWRNLNDAQAERFPTPEHLRKWCLIRAGFRDERSMVARSRQEALRMAAFIRPMDDYAEVAVEGATVVVFTAKSQSIPAMGAKVFQESKQKVLDILDDLMGVERGTLARQGEAA